MGLIVQKFGGTSVRDIERIKEIARIVESERFRGNKVIVVVSAMAGVTDELVNLTKQLSELKDIADKKEYDSIVSAGEQISSGLLALSLKARGISARSFLGWQLPIETDEDHTRGRILHINKTDLKNSLDRDEVPIVAGFQGIHKKRAVTLGRGGSDTTAAAIAAAVFADRCDIYTDVEGVMTADPKIVEKAGKLHHITYEEMLELAACGAKVLHTRAVEIAMKYKLKMQVLSSFTGASGTLLVDEQKIMQLNQSNQNMEKQEVTGITCDSNWVLFTINNFAGMPGSAAKLLSELNTHGININMILQNSSATDTLPEFSFSVSKQDKIKTIEAISSLKEKNKISYSNFDTHEDVAKISIVGIGIKYNHNIIQKMFEILESKNINILVISTSGIKISIIIKAEYKELAVRALHSGYGLDI